MAGALWDFLHTLFKNQCDTTILDQILKQKFPDIQEALHNDYFGVLLQKSLKNSDRKTLAANYTDFNSADVLVGLLNSLNISTSSIIDPFCGSGRLIVAFLNTLKSIVKFPRIRINDIMPSAVLLAYSRLLQLLSIYNQDFHLIEVSIGDAFSKIPTKSNPPLTPFDTYQTVLMNPPFTRTHRINNQQKKSLTILDSAFKEYLGGQTGLHIYAIILAYMLLESDGYLASVIPSATLLSNYSTGIQRLLLNDFQLKILASPDDQKACSEGSIFREILLIAKKNLAKKNNSVSFIRFLTYSKAISSRVDLPLVQLFKEWNWIMFLRDPRMLEVRQHFLKTGMIQSGKNLNLDIWSKLFFYSKSSLEL
jgi:tRNA1(Val) A37 N6-methylase TrmN6